MSFAFTPEEMNGLTDAEKDAIIDVVVAGLCADGNLKQNEIAKLDEEFRNITWGRPEAVMVKTIRTAYDKIRAFTTPEQAVEMVKHVAATLNNQSLREKAFAMLARVLYDGNEMTPNEQTVLTAFCVTLQFRLRRPKEMGEAVKSGH